MRSSKLYIRDSGLVHALLGVDSMEDLPGLPVAGPSWEGLAVDVLSLLRPRRREAGACAVRPGRVGRREADADRILAVCS